MYQALYRKYRPQTFSDVVGQEDVYKRQIFRPAAWNAFGMDKEGQDYRACKNFGPMYK